jgi:hypothetical protein
MIVYAIHEFAAPKIFSGIVRIEGPGISLLPSVSLEGSRLLTIASPTAALQP